MSKFEVNESRREIGFKGGEKRVLHNVKSVDFSGNYTRLEADEGYVIINPDNVLYYIVPIEAKVR